MFRHVKVNVRFLDSFSKELNVALVLGKQFWDAIVQAPFPNLETNKYAMVRTALVACNLVSPPNTIVDGIARLITKSDINGLCRKDRALQVQAAESMLTECWGLLQEGVGNNTVAQTVANALFGRLAARTALCPCNNQKGGYEGKASKSLTDIKNAFGDELLIETTPHEHADSSSGAAATPSSSAAAPKTTEATLADVADPAWIARTHGFNVGNYYQLKEDGKTGRLYKLEEMTGRVTFVEYSIGPGARDTITVDYNDLKGKWLHYKGKLHTRVACDLTMHQVDNNPRLQSDEHRCKIFCGLMGASREHVSTERVFVEYLLNPAEARCVEAIGIRKLLLLPGTDLSSVSLVRTDYPVLGAPQPFYLHMPMRIHSEKPAEWKPVALAVAFWWVLRTSSETEANMIMVQHKVNAYTFPALTNIKPLKPFDKLMVYVKAEPSIKRAKKQ